MRALGIGLAAVAMVLAIALAVALHWPWRLNPPLELARKFDPSPAEELIVDLPEDGQQWHTTLVYPANWQTDSASRQLAAFFASNSRLQSLVVQTKLHTYTSDNKLYAERYAKQMGGSLPQVWVQRGDGFVVYKASAGNMPATSCDLANEICEAIEQCCPQPTPTPKPGPGPGPNQPSPTTPGEPVPDIRPTDNDAAVIDLKGFPYWIGALPIVAVLLAMVVLQMAPRPAAAG